jgi:hypothetical protein
MIRALMEHCVECGDPDPEPDLICARCRPQYPLTISPPAQARDIPSARQQISSRGPGDEPNKRPGDIQHG